MAAWFPAHTPASYDRGKEVNRCRNLGCDLMWVTDRKTKALRCPSQCNMQRAVDLIEKESIDDLATAVE